MVARHGFIFTSTNTDLLEKFSLDGTPLATYPSRLGFTDLYGRPHFTVVPAHLVHAVLDTQGDNLRGCSMRDSTVNSRPESPLANEGSGVRDERDVTLTGTLISL